MGYVLQTGFRILNRLIRKPENPGGRESLEAYAEIEFQKSHNLIQRFAPYNQVKDKCIVDVGCGPGGQALYYASQGASLVVGFDIDSHNIRTARCIASSKDIQNAEFLVGNACDIPCPSDSVDMVIMNSVIEHLRNPYLVLTETFRVLKEGGILNLVFPLYHSPYGAHLYDYIHLPWAHLIFPEYVLLKAWRDGYKIDYEKGTNRVFGGIKHVSSASTLDDLFYVSRLSLDEWEKLICSTPFRVLKRSYRKMRYWGRLTRIFPALSKYVTYSALFVLQKDIALARPR
jgi:ubiquinone/menaquinone biosynthesis C-methylase UbiE